MPRTPSERGRGRPFAFSPRNGRNMLTVCAGTGQPVGTPRSEPPRRPPQSGSGLKVLAHNGVEKVRVRGRDDDPLQQERLTHLRPGERGSLAAWCRV